MANPPQGDFAKPGHGFNDEGPALVRLPQRCDKRERRG
jgi:hypothetical protein